MATPKYRYLRGYTIDPGFSTQLDTMSINEMIYKIPWEELKRGPIGEYIEVIDWDPSNGYIYEPVDLDSKELLSQHGLSPGEDIAAGFHQQFVYAVIMQTIENFEKALGRKINWQRRRVKNNKVQKRKTKKEYRDLYVEKLRVYPHAMREANAFYSRDKVALLFGYFEAGSRIQGSNFPGGVVFTCLSPDIIAHETTHAILDSIHPNYMMNTHPDVPAFHEAFADIVALLQRFSNPRLVEHQLERTRGRLDEYSLLGELATQFGQALETGRGSLRSAIGKYDKKSGKWQRIVPDPTTYQETFESHERGAILVATIFDAFMRLYNFRTQDLLRIATQGTGVLPQGAIHPDLVKRLSREASETAGHLLLVCIRALDYCPPFDINFGDYLRALITADKDVCPDDDNSYRVALIEAFRARGIFPDSINTLTLHSLTWAPPAFTRDEKDAIQCMAGFLKSQLTDVQHSGNRESTDDLLYELRDDLHEVLEDPTRGDIEGWMCRKLPPKTWESLFKKFGLMFKPFTCEYDGVTLQFDGTGDFEVHSIRPAFRVGQEGKQLEQVIVTLTQSHVVKGGLLKGKKMDYYNGHEFRSGCTIILSVSGNRLCADYIVVKKADSNRRIKTQLDYQLRKTAGYSLTESLYESDHAFDQINFEKLHFH